MRLGRVFTSIADPVGWDTLSRRQKAQIRKDMYARRLPVDPTLKALALAYAAQQVVIGPRAARLQPVTYISGALALTFAYLVPGIFVLVIGAQIVVLFLGVMSTLGILRIARFSRAILSAPSLS